tara:strand:- start:438 stop:569 length:132 start_codon:yes stop_codon:yes gene_type:complete
MSNDKKSQEFLAGKMKTLKKVKKELEKASRMHKSQADRIGKLL